MENHVSGSGKDLNKPIPTQANNLNKEALFLIPYLLVVIILLIYSFSQIDLNLTLSSNPVYQSIQNILIELGYYLRPLSTTIFLLIIILLFIFYFIALQLIEKKLISKPTIIKLIAISGILILAYPAFSHDIFNQIFYAKIVLFYKENPYILRPLDYPLDEWTRFMNWTHTTYPWGPLWLVLSLIPLALGMGKFVLTLLSFKIFLLLFHLINILLIKKIVNDLDPRNSLFAVIFYTLNPLVLVEVLVNGHLDVVMLTFLLASLFFYVNNKFVKSFTLLLFSSLTKFVTAPLLVPLILNKLYFKKNVNWLIEVYILIFLLSLIPVIIQREPYPWYFVPVIGLISLVSKEKWALGLSIIVSLSTLLRYAPYLYQGDYQPPVFVVQNTISIVILVCGGLLGAVKLHRKQ